MPHTFDVGPDRFPNLLFDLFDRGAEAEAIASKRVIAFQLQRQMTAPRLTKTTPARRMGTNRSALDHLLDPDNASATLLALERAAKALGQRIRIGLAA